MSIKTQDQERNEKPVRQLYSLAEATSKDHGKMASFDCYLMASVLLGQLGVLGNLGTVFKH